MLGQFIERYKTFWRSYGSGNHSADSSDPVLNRIYLVLHQFQRNRSFIEIVLDGDERVYQSMILSVDPDERTILIDELFPTGFIGLPGQPVRVSVRQQAGRKTRFQSVILERHSQNGVPLYVIAMPETLDTDQRRSAYRLPIYTTAAIESHFTTPDDLHYTARVRNVSSTGLCMEVEDESIELHYNDHLTHVAFDFAGLNIDCELAVRNIMTVDGDNSANNHWLIGGEFLDVAPADQRILEKSIMRIQRERIKYSGDSVLEQAIA